MLTSILVGLICITLLIYWLRRDPYAHIPGPSLWDLIWKYKTDVSKTHVLFTELTAKYGPVFKLPQIGSATIVVLNDFDSIHQVSVTDGKLFGGRPSVFRLDALMAGTGIIINHEPDHVWKSLRQTAQRHLRQFGDGLSRLEAITSDIAEDMFNEISNHCEKPYDPKHICFDTALNTIAFLILGKRIETGDPIVEQMREYEMIATKLFAVAVPPGLQIFEFFPWMRHLGIGSWELFTRAHDIESKIWHSVKDYYDENPDAAGIYKVYMAELTSGNPIISETDAIKSVMSLLLAGVATTSYSFYGLVNLLAHNREVQKKLYEEMQKIQQETGREASLSDRPNMHYTRAVLLEMGRYLSIGPAGLLHRNITEAQLKGFKIPVNSQIMLNQWNLHHDDKFWDKPYSFIPERFLEQSGELVPPDHPNRKHLMPFGAGTRVCLGENLALTRLFVWLTTLIQRFVIEPADGNTKELTDPRNFTFGGLLRPCPYEVIIKKRN